jgi:putative phage-type endonuclease
MLTDEDIRKRATGIGSSEIAAIAGEHPYNNAHRVWLSKRGLVEPNPPSDATWLGHEMEPIIAKRYAAEMGVTLRPGPGTVSHPDHPWALATTDYEWSCGSRIVECKWVGARPMAHWTMEADGAPAYVNLQQQWQMFVRGIDRADTVVIFGATAEFRIYEFRRDDAIIDALLKIGARFWSWVENGTPPPVDETDDARKVMAALYPTHRKPLKAAPAGAEEWLWKYVRADDAEEEASKAKLLAGNHLREMIGEAEGIEGPWGTVTWRADKHGKRTLRVYPRKAA